MKAMAKNESPATPVCVHCFAEYEIGDDFCPKCGKPVGDATSTMPFIPPPGEDFEEHGEEKKDESA
jgi:predicted amidophosphoribosyltransferase